MGVKNHGTFFRTMSVNKTYQYEVVQEKARRTMISSMRINAITGEGPEHADV